jgi:hypothetical protein
VRSRGWKKLWRGVMGVTRRSPERRWTSMHA